MTVAFNIRVHKSEGVLELFSGDACVRRISCITGTNKGDKEMEGDRRTPVGHFRVVYKNPNSKFFLSLGLNYPRILDANRGLFTGLLTYPVYRQLVHDLITADMTLETVQDRVWKTPLGGEIFIHGCAEGRSDTAGCVALSNPDMLQLFHQIPVGTSVEILP